MSVRLTPTHVTRDRQQSGPQTKAECQASAWGDQSSYYTEIADWHGHRLRFVVKWDRSYPQQSSAHVDRWDGAQWQQVAFLWPATITDCKMAVDLLVGAAGATLLQLP